VTAATLIRPAVPVFRPPCPGWCNGNPETHPLDDAVVIHCRDWPDDKHERAVVTLDQLDVRQRPGWKRHEPVIGVLQSNRVAEFSELTNLDAAQARGVASLVADRGDEDLARRLLAAAEAVEASA
jgi:hypothetical protein